MVRCRYKLCPRCKQDVLFVMRRADDRRFYLHCEECEWAWDAPSDTAAVEKGYLGLDVEGDYATEDDIADAGWSTDAFQCGTE
jgi:hypothetical protein